MSKATDYRLNLPSKAIRAFSDAALSLSLFFSDDMGEDAEYYYYARYKFNIMYAISECGIEDAHEFDYYVREYAEELMM